MRVIQSDKSTFLVQTVVPAGAPPTSDNGTLNWALEPDSDTSNPLTCGGYQPNDDTSFQFFLGQASLGSILYRITYTVTNTKPKDAQFCLGRVNFTFRTLSGKNAAPATLPNGLQGYVGLLPMCQPADIGTLVPCVVSKTPSGSSDTLLRVQVPALKGDPWGRS
jgi:hypothetical protein